MVKTLIGSATTNNNGVATFNYTGDGSGEIDIFAESEDYLSNKITILDYTPVPTTMEDFSNNGPFYVGDSISFRIYVYDQYNLPIKNIPVDVLIWEVGDNYEFITTETTDTTGLVTYTIVAESVGETPYYCFRAGDIEFIMAVIVSKLNSSLTINVPALVYSDVFDITGVLKDSKNNPISGALIKLIRDENILEATGTTNASGEVTFHKSAPTTITDYTFQLQFEGNNNYNGSNSSVESRTVGKETTILTIDSPLENSTIMDSNLYISGTLTDNKGTPLSNRTIRAQILQMSSSSIISTTTDANGEFNMSYPNVPDGLLQLIVAFYEENYYSACSKQIQVTKLNYNGISLSSDKDIISASDGEYTTLSAQLTKNGVAVNVSGETVTFEVIKQSDNSLVETLTGYTDSSGKATVSYYGKGAGDLNIKSKCGTLFDTILIEDCHKIITNQVTVQANTQIVCAESTSNFILTYEYYPTDTWEWSKIYFDNTLLGVLSSSYDLGGNFGIANLGYNSWKSITIRKENNQLTISYGVTTVSKDVFNYYEPVSLIINNNRLSHVRNLKCKEV